MIIKRKLFNLLEMAINPAGHHIKKAQEKKQEESKLFARRDYEGLTGDEKYTLTQERSKVAKELAKKRNKISKSYQGHVNEIEKIAEDDIRKNILSPDGKGKNVLSLSEIEKNKKARIGNAKVVKNDQYKKAISEAKTKAAGLKDKIKNHKIEVIKDPKVVEDSIAKHAEKANELRKLKKIRITKKAAIGTAIGVSAVGLGAAGVKAYKKKKESDKMEQARKSVFNKK